MKAQTKNAPIVHQYWNGAPMPQHMQEWCDGVKAWAEARGWNYHLWNGEELEALFADEVETRTLARCRAVLPTSTTEGIAGDWWRYRLLAEFGGIWLDTDFIVRDADRLNSWKPAADIACISEGWKGNDSNICCLWSTGKRGQAAARLLRDAAGDALHRLLPLDAADFAARYIRLTRSDSNKSGLAKTGIGPWRFRSDFLPCMKKGGFTHEIIPQDIAADRRKNTKAALVHWGSGTWKENTADWQQREKEAALEDFYDSKPRWQRPQLKRELPPALRRRIQSFLPNPTADGLFIPQGCRRIVIFSNVPKFNPNRADIRIGDCCVHINRAVHFDAVKDIPGTYHVLIVRSGHNRKNGKKLWYEPRTKEGIQQVIFIHDASMSARRPWWRTYRQATRKCPTSGFIAWHLALDAANKTLPIILAGFAPGVPCGSPLWHGHAWNYEADAYAKAKAHIISPIL